MFIMYADVFIFISRSNRGACDLVFFNDVLWYQTQRNAQQQRSTRGSRQQ